jgi:hypothetical protein
MSWAEDEFMTPPPLGPQAGGDVPKMRGNYGFKVGQMDGNFRDMDTVQLNTVVPEDMEAPFVAYVGNLPHGIDDTTVMDNFADVDDVLVVSRDKSTFAYVVFATRDSLQAAILTTGKIVGGRKVKVDIASEQQRARLDNERNGTQRVNEFELGREGMGGAQQSQPTMGMGGQQPGRGMTQNFSRDDMGGAQQGAMGMGGGRDGMGQMPPRGRFGGSGMDMGGMSRDSMGGSEVQTPTTGGFDRESFGMKQQSPKTANAGRFPAGGRGKPASPVGEGQPAGGWRQSPTGAKPARATTRDKIAAGGWRDSDAEAPAQPKAEEEEAPAVAVAKPAPVAEKKPVVNAWRRSE